MLYVTVEIIANFNNQEFVSRTIVICVKLPRVIVLVA